MNNESKISQALDIAREAGEEAEMLAAMRRFFKKTTGWNPTKKRPSPAQRKAKRLVQREARRRNRNTMRGQKCQKGNKTMRGKR